MYKARISFLLAGAALIALSDPSLAASKKQPAPPPPDPRIGVLEQQLRDLQQQLAEIKGTPAPDYSAAVTDLKRSTSSQYSDINNRLDAQTKVGLDMPASPSPARMARSACRCALWCSSMWAISRKAGIPPVWT